MCKSDLPFTLNPNIVLLLCCPTVRWLLVPLCGVGSRAVQQRPPHRGRATAYCGSEQSYTEIGHFLTGLILVYKLYLALHIPLFSSRHITKNCNNPTLCKQSTSDILRQHYYVGPGAQEPSYAEMAPKKIDNREKKFIPFVQRYLLMDYYVEHKCIIDSSIYDAFNILCCHTVYNRSKILFGHVPRNGECCIAAPDMCVWRGRRGGRGEYIYKNFIGQPNHSSSSPVSLFPSPLTVQISSMFTVHKCAVLKGTVA
jgi:hypothetical protein